MRRLYTKFALAALLAASATSVFAQECLSTTGCMLSASQWPTATQTTSSTSFTQIANNMYAGEFAVCNVTAGVAYQWSLCAADGAVTGYDSQLTLFHGTTNAQLCYSDDNCGTDAKIGWTATFTGTVKIQVNDYGTAGCETNSINTTLVWRTVPSGTDAAVTNLYTYGTVATNNTNPNVISARVINAGTTTFTNLPVTLTVSGANTYTNTQTIPSLASGASVIVNFAGFSSTNTGSNTVTVTIPSTDDVAANNTATASQTVTTSTVGYPYGTTVTGGAGFNTGTGEVVAKFTTNGAASVNQIKVYFPSTSVGNQFKVKLWNATGTGNTPGTVLYTSTNQTSVAGVNTVTLTTPVIVPATFYIGVEQVTANVNMGVGYQSEDPLRPQSFYYNTNATTPLWTDLSPTPFRIMVEAGFVCPVPAAPGAITGPATTCGPGAVSYSVPAVTGATSYTWTAPTGWSGTSTTNSITLTPGTASGNVTVAATNNCGNSTAATLSVTASTGPPAQPAAISGSASACSGLAATYSVPAVTGATSYSWTLPSGWSGTSTSNSISATASTTGGTISVIATNACGTSSAQTMAVTVGTVPATPGAISGNAAVCGGSSNTFSVPAVTGATSYNWTMPSGWSGTSTSNSITAAAGNGGTISVTANNSCGPSPASVFAVSVTPLPAQPAAITGNASLCEGTSASYSVSTVPGATSYNWTLPSGWSGTSTSNSITVMAGAAGSGSISVSASNSCGTSTAQTLAVSSIAGAPAQPGAITGSATACSGANVTYTVPVVSGATSYTWTLPGGWTGSSTTNSINAVTGNTGGTISVVAGNSCGTSPVQTLPVTVTTVAQPGAITGPVSVCEGTTVTYTVPNPGANISLGWTMPADWTPGPFTQNSMTFTVGSTSGIISVAAANGNCVSDPQTLNVTVNALPAIPTISVAGNVLSSSATTGNQWSLNGTPITGATGQFHTATSNGFYTVSVTNAAGCSSVSAPFNHTMVGVEDAFAAGLNLAVYPNPASNYVVIKAENTNQDLQIEITSIVGRVIMKANAPSDNGRIERTLSTSGLSQGVYFITLSNKLGTTTRQLVIQ